MDYSTNENDEYIHRGVPITEYQRAAETIFQDEYEHINDDIEYVPENVLQSDDVESESFHRLSDQFNSVLLMSCRCESSDGQTNVCGSSSSSSCAHGRNYCRHINEQYQELVLNPDRPSQDLIYECSDQCACPSACNNRLVQFGPRKWLQIADFTGSNKKYGLITVASIPSGGFICEYAGEILTKDEVARRRLRNDAENLDNYIICLNERSMASDDHSSSDDMEIMQTFIDPSRKGNIGRYLNHSCDPNCEILSVRIDGPIPKLGARVWVLS